MWSIEQATLSGITLEDAECNVETHKKCLDAVREDIRVIEDRIAATKQASDDTAAA